MKEAGPNESRRRRARVVFPELERPERPKMNAPSIDFTMVVSVEVYSLLQTTVMEFIKSYVASNSGSGVGSSSSNESVKLR